MVDLSGLIERLITIAGILIAGLLSYWIIVFLSARLAHIAKNTLAGFPDHDPRVKTLSALIRLVGGIVIFFIAGSMILNELRVDIAPLLTGAGIVGLILTFSVQSLLKDIFAGIFILLENQYAPGMRVTLNEAQGVVEQLSLRTTILRDDKGSRLIIPNGSILIVNVAAEKKHVD